MCNDLLKDLMLGQHRVCKCCIRKLDAASGCFCQWQLFTVNALVFACRRITTYTCCHGDHIETHTILSFFFLSTASASHFRLPIPSKRSFLTHIPCGTRNIPEPVSTSEQTSPRVSSGRTGTVSWQEAIQPGSTEANQSRSLTGSPTLHTLQHINTTRHKVKQNSKPHQAKVPLITSNAQI